MNDVMNQDTSGRANGCGNQVAHPAW